MKPTLHFAHANGIPTGTYRAFLEPLRDHYHICSVAKLGHNPKYPVTNNWSLLKRELIHSIESQSSEPVVGVGHSLGGALTLMAALERPDLFKGLVMLDVPTFNRMESFLVYFAKATGLIDQVTPAKKSRTRRTNWPSKAFAMDYFAQRKMFANFSSQCLQDYVDCALVENGQGSFDLDFELEVELAIYRTLPHQLVLSKSQLKVPMGIIVGTRTDTVRRNQYQRMKEKLGFYSKRLEGSHMFPLEHPENSAKECHHLLQKMGIGS